MNNFYFDEQIYNNDVGCDPEAVGGPQGGPAGPVDEPAAPQGVQRGTDFGHRAGEVRAARGQALPGRADPALAVVRAQTVWSPGPLARPRHPPAEGSPRHCPARAATVPAGQDGAGFRPLGHEEAAAQPRASCLLARTPQRTQAGHEMPLGHGPRLTITG
jgi:hypothetical protein